MNLISHPSKVHRLTLWEMFNRGVSRDGYDGGPNIYPVVV